ncbi:hypothetical protein C9J85_13650 [Haloferax sp. wsp5]|nr:hypothetical protein C9J85_13650 [Haloferax sp. wsp5]
MERLPGGFGDALFLLFLDSETSLTVRWPAGYRPTPSRHRSTNGRTTLSPAGPTDVRGIGATSGCHFGGQRWR